MPTEPSDAVTRLLLDPSLDSDDRAASLLPLVYEQLRRVARQRMVTERAGHTLQATALVHEAYLRLVGDRRLDWQNRAHFYSAAAEAMRRILLDHARTRQRLKRGAGQQAISLTNAAEVADIADSWDLGEILSLEEAMCRLSEQDLAVGDVVRLRFYAGLSIDQTAAALDISPATVKRRWELGRTWLYRELQGEPDG